MVAALLLVTLSKHNIKQYKSSRGYGQSRSGKPRKSVNVLTGDVVRTGPGKMAACDFVKIQNCESVIIFIIIIISKYSQYAE